MPDVYDLCRIRRSGAGEMGYYIPSGGRRRQHRQTFHLGAHDGKLCPYCGEVMHVRYPNPHHHRDCPTRDHIIPRSLGGRRTIVVCMDCNNRKADMHPVAWLRYVTGWRPERVAHVKALYAGMGLLLNAPP